MRYQRAELHNHSVESDGSMTPGELMEWAEEHSYEVIALTDHNTCSGHQKARKAIQEKNLSVSLLEGVEVTTFYGHILPLGMKHRVAFSDLDPGAPEGFLKKLRAEGAAAIGLAHPFCLGRPVAAGCRFDMDIHDWDAVDYIEVFNTSAGTGARAEMIMGNEKALDLWEEKALEGHRLAAVTGKDIHGKPADAPVMITYALVEEGDGDTQDPAQAVLGAVLEQKTIVTRGPLFEAEAKDGTLTLRYDQSSPYLDWNSRWKETKPILVIRDNQGTVIKYPADFSQSSQEFPIKKEAERLVIRMYDKETDFADLLAAGVIVRQKKEQKGTE